MRRHKYCSLILCFRVSGELFKGRMGQSDMYRILTRVGFDSQKTNTTIK